MNIVEPFDSQVNNLVALANTLGHAVLLETLKLAAYYVNHSNGVGNTHVYHIKEAKSCYAFVQGTGLDVLICRFGMSYDPESIRDQFNYCVRRSG